MNDTIEVSPRRYIPCPGGFYHQKRRFLADPNTVEAGIEARELDRIRQKMESYLALKRGYRNPTSGCSLVIL